MTDCWVVLCTAPSPETAERLAESILARRLAACVSVLPGIRSYYIWKGEVCRDEERLLLIKTVPGAYPALEQAIRAQHPYEVPEILCLPVTAGWPPYLEWVRDSVTLGPAKEGCASSDGDPPESVGP